MRGAALLAALVLSGPATADTWAEVDIAILGEVHDNPAHHERQADLVSTIEPAALVFEMLTEDQAAAVNPDNRADADRLGRALGWAESGWPSFDMYYPIFAAAPQAATYGAAVPRSAARAVMTDGMVDAFPGDPARFGLDQPLPDDQQARRERLQMAAHCDALPETMLPMMVSVQRLRDATLASVALAALEETGGPVVVITGNGHARTDWGAPAAIALAAPAVEVRSLGQGETDTGAPRGSFDVVEIGPTVDRDDPCEAFRDAG